MKKFQDLERAEERHECKCSGGWVRGASLRDEDDDEGEGKCIRNAILDNGEIVIA